MDIRELETLITQDLAVELNDEFDRNFERKGFFTDKWPETKLHNAKGSLMMRSGNLRRSIKYNVRENMVLFSSSLPYASIHNEGGEITVTEKMKKYFWAMFKKASGAAAAKGNTKRSQRSSVEASQWKALALMKVGHKIKIEKRQMVGDHPEVARIVQGVLDDNIKLYSDDIAKTFKR